MGVFVRFGSGAVQPMKRTAPSPLDSLRSIALSKYSAPTVTTANSLQ